MNKNGKRERRQNAESWQRMTERWRRWLAALGSYLDRQRRKGRDSAQS